MHQVRYSEYLINFASGIGEKVIPLPDYDLEHLYDIRISIAGDPKLPGPDTVSRGVGNHIYDLRLYLAERDITTQVRSELIRTLESGQENVLRRHYQQALDRWFAKLHAWGLESLFPDLEAEKAISRELIQQPWSRLFDSFNTTSGGRRGDLHPLHYLYSSIPLQPLSLRSCLGIDDDRESAFADNANAHIVISDGPSQFVSGNAWTPPSNLPQGQLSIQLAFVFIDPWYEQMEETLDQVSHLLEDLRGYYEDLDARTSLLASDVLEISNSLLAYRTTVDAFRRSFEEWKSIPK